MSRLGLPVRVEWDVVVIAKILKIEKKPKRCSFYRTKKLTPSLSLSLSLNPEYPSLSLSLSLSLIASSSSSQRPASPSRNSSPHPASSPPSLSSSPGSLRLASPGLLGAAVGVAAVVVGHPELVSLSSSSSPPLSVRVHFPSSLAVTSLPPSPPFWILWLWMILDAEKFLDSEFLLNTLLVLRIQM
ncbi:uncharacterized protein LOC130957397 [Arachis stenosperma]|uniref:uncharacterized protein LOC130957397 n=1 Tax=Arachis stenosperma TaxID=217475 RepID=UPI0025AC3972|nr:uncharacterized protein LOC130957397 [Arachis stenosperma]